jgi:hypothetical protein
LNKLEKEKTFSYFQIFSPFYYKHPIKRKISEHLGKLISEKYAEIIAYNSFLIALDYEEFVRIYKKPREYNESITLMVKETAKEIINIVGK